MKNETFYQAKKLNEQIDELTKYINNLIRAKATCSRLVKISYSVGSCAPVYKYLPRHI